MQLHFPSLVVGVAAAAVLLVSMSQTTPSSGPPRIEYGPHPRDMVQIKEGTPYTVPVGKLFVLTGLGTSHAATGGCFLRVDSQQEVFAGAWSNIGIPYSVVPVATGFTAQAGSTLEVLENPSSTPATHNGRAWGYLANAH